MPIVVDRIWKKLPSGTRRGATHPHTPPNKRVQSDAAPRPGIGAKIGYVTHFELKHTLEKSRRG
jgi:hypothetical protein